MQAIILLGGQGTRLRDLYPDRPKALVPVAGKPFIERQVDWLRRGGATDIHLAAGFMADQIETWAASQDQITVTREPEPLGTGGALKYIEPHIQSNPFWVVNGDTLLPRLDFQRLPARPARHGRGAGGEKIEKEVPTIGKNDGKVFNDCPPDMVGGQAGKIVLAVTRIEDAGRFGTVEFDADDRVTAFREKSARNAGWINGGIYLMDRAALHSIPANIPYSLETDLFPALIEVGRLCVFAAEPPLLDMGTPDGLKAMERWLEGHARARPLPKSEANNL